MDREKANLMRLRVNRINLVQRIDPSEIIPKLVKFKVIDKDEAEAINLGRTREDRSRNLIDRLITKEHTQHDWYNHLRNILQDCNYKDLVVFLDNTIIKHPNFVSRFITQEGIFDNNRKTTDKNSGLENEHQLFEPTMIKNPEDFNDFLSKNDKKSFDKIILISFDEENLNSVMIKGNYEKKVSNLQTFSIRPEISIAELGKSTDSNDIKQIDYENITFIYMRKLELLYSLYQCEESIKNNFFLDSEVVSSIINSSHYYTYMKYFRNLKDSFGIDMLKFFKDSLIEHLKIGNGNLKFYDNLESLAKKLCWILIKNEENEFAHEVITSFLQHIKTIKESIDFNYNYLTLKNAFENQSLLLLIKNNLMDNKSALEIYNILSKLMTHIKNISIEPQLNCIQMYYGISQITLEEGSYDAAFDWINKALMVLEYKDDLIVDILGHATLCYSSKWFLIKARTLALLSIQIARAKHGKNHPAFIKALLCYGYFSNEFIQDKTTIFLAKYTLDLGKKIFGFDSLMVAEIHKSLSKALMANKNFENDLYLEHAQEAYKIASVYHKLDNPKLISYQTTLALALQWKGVQSTDLKEKKVFLQDSLEYCMKVMNMSKSTFGEINSRTAQIYLLMGSIYLYMEKLTESENYHIKCLEIFKVVLPEKNYHVLFAQSTLGVFYKVIGRINEACVLFQEVINGLDRNYDKIIPWIPTVYEYLIDCYRIKQLNDSANEYQQVLDKIKLDINKNQADFIIEIEKDPPYNIHQYILSFLQQ